MVDCNLGKRAFAISDEASSSSPNAMVGCNLGKRAFAISDEASSSSPNAMVGCNLGKRAFAISDEASSSSPNTIRSKVHIGEIRSLLCISPTVPDSVALSAAVKKLKASNEKRQQIDIMKHLLRLPSNTPDHTTLTAAINNLQGSIVERYQIGLMKNLLLLSPATLDNQALTVALARLQDTIKVNPFRSMIGYDWDFYLPPSPIQQLTSSSQPMPEGLSHASQPPSFPLSPLPQMSDDAERQLAQLKQHLIGDDNGELSVGGETVAEFEQPMFDVVNQNDEDQN